MTIPFEFERRFLVRSDDWRGAAAGVTAIRQAYLTRANEPSVRIRRLPDRAKLTIKAPRDGIGRAELEYPIPLDHADYLLDNVCARPAVEKLRHRVPYGGMVWVVDEFTGLNQGLVLAEIEMNGPTQVVPLPFWLGEEITRDDRFRNSSLYHFPYAEWGRRDAAGMRRT